MSGYQLPVRNVALLALTQRGDEIMPMTREDGRSAVAAALIIAASFCLFWAMPTIVLWLGGISPWLGFLGGALIIGAFFLPFVLRARFQRRADRARQADAHVEP